MFKNINKEELKNKLKLSKKSIITNTCIVVAGVALGATLFSGCNKDNDKNNTKPTIQTIEQNDTPETLDNEVETFNTLETAESVENVETIENVEPVEITELGIEEFNKLVEEVEKANTEAGLNLRKENLELVVYINNIDKASKELVEKMESSYNYNEEDMINVYLKTITSYNNDKLEYYNGEDTKSADVSLTFTDKIDRETVKYVDSSFEELRNSKSEEELTSKMGSVVEELKGYTRENNTINGYTKDQLTVGGLFTTKLMIDDAFAYFATTGYANAYESDISAIAEANFETVIARTYSVLGSKAALVECEDKTLIK